MWRYLLILKDEPKTAKEGKLGMFTFFVTTSGFTATRRPSRFPPSDNTRSCVPWVKLVCEWCEGGAEEASWCRWCKGVLAAEVSFGPGGLWLVFEYPVINKGVSYCRPETKPNENSIMQGNAWSKFFVYVSAGYKDECCLPLSSSSEDFLSVSSVRPWGDSTAASLLTLKKMTFRRLLLRQKEREKNDDEEYK